jgi:hypothetical protein
MEGRQNPRRQPLPRSKVWLRRLVFYAGLFAVCLWLLIHTFWTGLELIVGIQGLSMFFQPARYARKHLTAREVRRLGILMWAWVAGAILSGLGVSN